LSGAVEIDLLVRPARRHLVCDLATKIRTGTVIMILILLARLQDLEGKMKLSNLAAILLVLNF
jgi:hypothetical protein